MHVLFVHQNYPAQFHDVGPALAERGWQCTFATANTKTPAQPGVRKVIYHPIAEPRIVGGAGNEGITRSFLSETAHARGVYEALKAYPEIRPDLVVAHSGFGSSLYLPHLYDAPIINFFEYFFRPRGLAQHLGYRADLSVNELSLLRMRVRNACFLLDLDNCDRGWCPNNCQRDTLPEQYHPKLEVIPEGIDCELWKSGPRSDSERTLPDGTVVPVGTRIVTYCARGLERMRGFDVFMKAAKRIYQQLPNVLFVVVGDDKSYYNDDRRLTGNRSFREWVLSQDEYDLTKFRFTGKVPEAQLAQILGMSDLHVYLTEPFVTSWSLLDAMSSGCVVLASDQTCVREYIKDGENGLLTDFFDAERMAERAVEVLSDLPKHRALGDAARRTITEGGYALRDTLPRIEDFFKRVAAMGPRTPSMRAALIVRAGALAAAKERTTAAAVAELTPTAPSPCGFEGTIPWRVMAEGHDESQVIIATDTPNTPDCEGKRKLEQRPEGIDVSLSSLHESRAPSPGVVMFCWELGAGLGHLSQIKSLAADLVAAGHRVFVAARNLDIAEAVLAGTGVSYLAAPYLAGGKPRDRRAFPAMRSLAHVLGNCGWASEAELMTLASSWRNLFRMTRPDLLVFDYAPAALLAARGLPSRKIVIGSGFCCPPATEPLPAFHPETIEAAKLLEDEQKLVRVANRVTARFGWPTLNRLADLFAEVDETFLITLPELDHYPQRANGAYWGPTFCGAGLQPCTSERRAENVHRKGNVFAYLARNSMLPDLLEALRESGRPAVAYVRDVDPKLRKRYAAADSTLRVTDRPVDLSQVVRECGVAILNAGHGTTAQFLLAGVPVLLLPQVEEQTQTADAVAKLGAGERLPADPIAARGRLRELLTAEGDDTTLSRYADAARAFATRYAAFDTEKQRRAMRTRAEELLNRRPPKVTPSIPRPGGRSGASERGLLGAVV